MNTEIISGRLPGRKHLMRVANTQREAFRSLSPRDYLQPKERQVMDAFPSADTTMTRQQLSDATGMKLNCICGRVRSLLDKGVLTVRGITVDSQTRKSQELLGVPVYEQGALF